MVHIISSLPIKYLKGGKRGGGKDVTSHKSHAPREKMTALQHSSASRPTGTFPSLRDGADPAAADHGPPRSTGHRETPRAPVLLAFFSKKVVQVGKISFKRSAFPWWHVPCPQRKARTVKGSSLAARLPEATSAGRALQVGKSGIFGHGSTRLGVREGEERQRWLPEC